MRTSEGGRRPTLAAVPVALVCGAVVATTLSRQGDVRERADAGGSRAVAEPADPGVETGLLHAGTGSAD